MTADQERVLAAPHPHPHPLISPSHLIGSISILPSVLLLLSAAAAAAAAVELSPGGGQELGVGGLTLEA